MGIMSVLSKIFGVKPQALEGKEIGKITHYYGNLNVGIIELSDALKVGDRIPMGDIVWRVVAVLP